MVHTRLDRNFLTKASEITDQLAEQDNALLTKRLIVYLAFAFQYNWDEQDLFGSRTLQVKKFAEAYKLNPQALRNPSPNPSQLRNKTRQEVQEIIEQDQLAITCPGQGKPAWLGRFDNAVYNVYNYPATFTKPGKTPEGINTSELHRMHVLKDVKKWYVNKKGQSVYEYTLADSFIRNTASYFAHIDFNLFRQLTSMQEVDAYLSLELCKTIGLYSRNQLQADNVITYTEATIDLLANRWKLAGKPHAPGANPFRVWKKRINEIIASLNKKAGYTFVELSWRKARISDVFEGQPVFHFPMTSPEQQQMVNSKGVNQMTLERFDFFLIHFLREHFRGQYPGKFVNLDDFDKKFLDYMLNTKIDVANKKRIVFETYQIIYRRHPASEHYESAYNSLPIIASDADRHIRNKVRLN